MPLDPLARPHLCKILCIISIFILTPSRKFDNMYIMARSTIQKVAKKAGVSTATVSRCLDGHPYISEKARRRVRQAIEETGYDARSRYKANGNRKRTNNVGLLLPKEQNDVLRLPLNTQLFMVLDQALAREGMHLVVAYVSREQPLPPTVCSDRLDAMLFTSVLLPLNPEWDMFNPIRMRGPVDSSPHCSQWNDIITCDYVRGGRLAADYLIKRGHHRLSYFNPWPTHRSLRIIGQAFNDYGRQSGAEVVVLPVDRDPGLLSEDILNPYRSLSVVEKLVDQMLSLPVGERPTGLHVANDEIALLVYRSLAEHGVEVGKDIDIISRDNEEPFLATLSPRPASIDINCAMLVEQTVNRILYRLSHPETPQGLSILVPPTIAEGEIVWQEGHGARQ